MIEDYQLLEQELAQWIGCNPNQIVACSSGTAALHLGIEALRIPLGNLGKKHNIICPNYTMIACPLSITLAGHEPIFVDCNDELLMDSELVETGIDKRTRAIMAVHVYGRMCNVIALHELADKYGLHVIEDMAEAHGCKPHPNTHVACWSFYKNKIVHGEEGGCCYFQSDYVAGVARSLRSVGFTEAHDYTHIPRGHNYRMSNTHARMVSFSLKLFSQELDARRKLEQAYDAQCPELWKMPWRESPWVYDIRIPGLMGWNQDKIIRDLQAEGIAARCGFKPMSTQEQFVRCKRVGGKASLHAMDEMILLPLSTNQEEGVAELAFKTIQHVTRRAV